MRKDEQDMRRRRRASRPDIMNVIYTMVMCVNHFGQDSSVTLDRLHVLLAQKMGQMQTEIFYADILGETEPGYAVHDFWKVVKSLWLTHRVGRDLYNEARVLEGKYTEAELEANVDYAIDAMLKKTGAMVQIECQKSTTGYEFMSWVAPSTYEVN